MAVASPAVTIERIDHGVLPSGDLGRSFQFWTRFMGGELDHLTNLNLRGLNREVPQIAFYSVANHRGFGLALQEFAIPTTPERDFEGAVYGFEVAADDLAGAAALAEERKVRVRGQAEYPAPSPIAKSLFVLDPDGNTVELCIRRDPSSDAPQGDRLPLRRISHVRLEVTDLAEGERWYRDTFGLVVDDQVPGTDQITLTVPRTGQLVILHRVDQMSERATRPVKGPHVDFRIPSEHYPTILERFDRKEYYWGTDPTKIPWHEIGGHTVYGYDPFDNRIQIGEAFRREQGH